MARRPVARDTRTARRAWGLVLFGLVFLAIGVGALVAVPLETIFHCERDARGAGECFVSEEAIVWSSIESFQANEFRGGYVDVDQDDEGTTCRVVVTLTQGREIPLSRIWTNCTQGMNQQAQRLSAFAASTKASELTLERPAGWWVWVFVAAFGLPGLFIMVLGLRRR